MAFEKQNYIDGITVVTKQHMDNIENGIIANQDAIDALNDKFQNVSVEVDTTLTQAGKAADAKAVGDKISQLKEDITNKQGLTRAQINALNGLLKLAKYETNPSEEYNAFKQAFGITDDELETITYAITNNLTNAVNSNSKISIDEGSSYSANISASSGYVLSNVSVVMNGEDVTSSVYSNGVINILSVSGDIVITVVAIEENSEATVYSITNTLTNVTSNNSSSSVEENTSYNATLTASDGYTLEGATVTVTIGGIDVTSTVYSDGVITIPSVTGNVVITASAIEYNSEPTLQEITVMGTFPIKATWSPYENAVTLSEEIVSGQQYRIDIEVSEYSNETSSINIIAREVSNETVITTFTEFAGQSSISKTFEASGYVNGATKLGIGCTKGDTTENQTATIESIKLYKVVNN